MKMRVSEKMVCECKMVPKIEITNAIRKGGCQTIVDIQNTTGASTGCGKCKPAVIDILMKELQKQLEASKQLKLPF
jgi:NAD(P)H-nitrite reductase large subunit